MPWAEAAVYIEKGSCEAAASMLDHGVLVLDHQGSLEVTLEGTSPQAAAEMLEVAARRLRSMG